METAVSHVQPQPQPAGSQRDHALPDRLRDRRGLGDGSRDGLGWGDVGQIALAVGLAYMFGFGLTALPLVRAGLAAGVVVSTALASDTVSITIMEVIDNSWWSIPGAMEAGLTDPLLRQSRWASRSPIRSLSGRIAT